MFSATYPTRNGTIHVLGNEPRMIDDLEISRKQAIALGAREDKIAQLIVASDATKNGHKSVYPAIYTEPQFWDGAVAKDARSAVVMQTADCPTICVTDKNTGRVVIAHAGRPAMTGNCTVVGNAVHAALKGYDGAENLEVTILRGISGKHFKHDHEEARPLIEPFFKLPEEVFFDKATGALELTAVIRHHFLYHGVPASQISEVGPCTYETEGLASYRRNRTPLRNTIIYVML